MNSLYVIGKLARARFAPRSIYFGWFIVASAFLADFARSGYTGFLFSVYLKPVSAEFGWTRTTVSAAVTAGSIAAALLAFVVGPLIDKYGPRLVLAAGAIGASLGYIGLSFTGSLWQFYLFYALGRGSAMTPLGEVVTVTVVAKWFVRKRGRAAAITLMGSSLGGAVLAAIGQQIINSYGIFTAWRIFAAITFAIVFLPSLLLMRRQPEDMGLLPDGDRHTEEATGSAGGRRRISSYEYPWTLKLAIRTPAFWVVNAAVTLSAVTTGAIMFHLVAMYTDKGISATVAATALGGLALASGGARLFWGYLAERFPVRYCLAASLAGAALAIILLWRAESPPMAYVSAIAFGCMSGGIWTMSSVIWSDYFGRAFQGAIRGFTWPFAMFGNAVVPLLAALAYDITGNYNVVLMAVFGALALIAVLASLARPPKFPLAARLEAAP